nr:immunoglobulin light chain junction region [Macaca mulatta]MOX47681.1 immunoglobulin light chain junction region [Macaca mulatta]MOX47690.1 immunoglobulin light chain junction region [Macaca mulatta]MOX47788.1 immunoglobulin light chain junction region [Macaca mulatta]MOX47809.1 immunoglobulin light chain junction region [Macaca mulatta]
CLQYNSGPITF